MAKQFQILPLILSNYAKARENKRRILGCPQDNWKNDPTIQGQKRIHEGKKTRVSWLLSCQTKPKSSLLNVYDLISNMTVLYEKHDVKET